MNKHLVEHLNYLLMCATCMVTWFRFQVRFTEQDMQSIRYSYLCYVFVYTRYICVRSRVTLSFLSFLPRKPLYYSILLYYIILIRGERTNASHDDQDQCACANDDQGNEFFVVRLKEWVNVVGADTQRAFTHPRYMNITIIANVNIHINRTNELASLDGLQLLLKCVIYL